MTTDRLQIVRECYGAYESGERGAIERHLSEDFTFYSPYDVGIDRARYFERCWPNAGQLEAFEFVRLVEVGDEVLVTYESRKTDGPRCPYLDGISSSGSAPSGPRTGPPCVSCSTTAPASPANRASPPRAIRWRLPRAYRAGDGRQPVRDPQGSLASSAHPGLGRCRRRTRRS